MNESADVAAVIAEKFEEWYYRNSWTFGNRFDRKVKVANFIRAELDRVGVNYGKFLEVTK